MVSAGLAVALGATMVIIIGPNSATATPNGAVSYSGNPVWSVWGDGDKRQQPYAHYGPG